MRRRSSMSRAPSSRKSPKAQFSCCKFQTTVRKPTPIRKSSSISPTRKAKASADKSVFTMPMPPERDKLDLSGRQLTSVPPDTWQDRSLRVLNLYRNKLKILPADIAQLTRLQVLIVAN